METPSVRSRENVRLLGSGAYSSAYAVPGMDPGTIPGTAYAEEYAPLPRSLTFSRDRTEGVSIRAGSEISCSLLRGEKLFRALRGGRGEQAVSLREGHRLRA